MQEWLYNTALLPTKGCSQIPAIALRLLNP
jgi:hypothetical protein